MTNPKRKVKERENKKQSNIAKKEINNSFKMLGNKTIQGDPYASFTTSMLTGGTHAAGQDPHLS